SVQIVSTVELCAAGDAGAIHGAGYAVQLLPGSNAEVMRTMTESLESREALLASSSANDLIERLAGKIAVTPLAASDLRFECGCSRDRVVATIAGLERSELAELTARNEAVEVNCDGCNRTYRVEPGELSALVTAGRS
ncbi:MAG: Hsp33 family molecular chaperone HslO, partial [Deltaproteobacteria bacterium]|nr:Hsp33 family molecular chaperone HslO [Deltaproteobacteria bacterium]